MWNDYLKGNNYKCEGDGEENDNSCPYILVIEFSKKKLLDKNIDMNEIFD